MNHPMILDIASILHSKVLLKFWSSKVLNTKSFTQQSRHQREHNQSKGFLLVTRSTKREPKRVCVVSRLPHNTRAFTGVSTP